MLRCVSVVLCLDKLYFLHSTEILPHYLSRPQPREDRVSGLLWVLCVTEYLSTALFFDVFFFFCLVLTHRRWSWPADPLFSSLGLRLAAWERQDASHGRRSDPQRWSKGPPRPGQVLPVQNLSAHLIRGLISVRCGDMITEFVIMFEVQEQNLITS